MTTDLILHHYDSSPFAEKARLMLGYKGLGWQSVKIPQVMPKPDLTALTGGYRRTPVLQVGADVYCDTALIARVLEQHRPAPPLFPSSAPLAPLLAQWADSTLFWIVIPYTMQPAGAAALFAGVSPQALKAFREDRAPFTAGLKRRSVADATVALAAALAALDAQLQRAPWVAGEAVSVADFAVAHTLWFVRRGGPVADILAPHRHVVAWLDRVLGFGHGDAMRLDAAAALRIAAEAAGHAPCEVLPGLGPAAGTRVVAAATDYGTDPVAGELVGLTADELVLRRHDPRAGTVHVHFPRQGYQFHPETP